uniref:C-type lectin domain-containing protein n=1 Tax=Bactrocera latifrons TaxID=174628 RepID=A0A0K8VJN4_BACLA
MTTMFARLKLKHLLCCLILLPLLLLSIPIDPQSLGRSCGRAQGEARYFIPFRGSCFHIPKRSMNWFTGMRYCLVNGLTLATLDEHEKMVLITRHCQRHSMRQEYWFGATDLGMPNAFWYISNGLPIRYGPKKSLEEESTEHCLKLNIHANSTYIARDSCLAVHPVICERVESGTYFREYNKIM